MEECQITVLIIDGNSEIGAHMWSYFCLKHLFMSRAVTNLIFFPQKRPIFLYMSDLLVPSNLSTNVRIGANKGS